MVRLRIAVGILFASLAFRASAIPLPDAPDYHPGDALSVAFVVNGRARGEIFAFVDGDGLWIRASDLARVGIAEPDGEERMLAGERLLRLDSLVNVRGHFDEQGLTVGIDIDAALLANQVIDLSSEPRMAFTTEPAVNGYLNGSLDYQREPGSSAAGATALLNLRAAGWLLRSEHDWMSGGRDPAHIRFATNLTRDWPGPALRLTLGDVQAFSGDLGRARTLAGITFSRVFQLHPGFQPSPAAALSASVLRPSVAEIYVDGTLLRTVNLDPGTVDFSNLRYYTGLRTTEVVIRDNFGNRSVIDLPFYFTNDVLEKGLHDFSYHAGYERPDTTRDRYDRPTFSAYHRYGLSDSLTLGARGDGVRGAWSVGPTASLRLKPLGVFTAAWSRAGGADRPRDGSASAFGWGFSVRGFTASALVRRFSEYYTYDADLAALDLAPLRRSVSAAASLAVARGGTVSISGESLSLRGAPDERRLTLGYSVALGGRLGLYATLSRVTGATDGVESALTVSYAFSDRLSASATSQRDVHGDTASYARLARSAPLGEGWGAFALASRTRTREAAELTGEWNAPVAQVAASVRRDVPREGEPATSWRTGVGGSLAYATGGGWHATRPIAQSFAIVKAGELAGVSVLQGSQVLGRTGASGVLIVPDMGSLSPTTFALRDTDVPLAYSLGATARRVLPMQNAGLLVPFDLRRIHALSGRLFARMSEGHVAIENRVVLIWAAKLIRPRELPIGQGGLFYLEDVVSGSYLLSAKLPQGQCSVRIDVPEHGQPVWDVGEIDCEIEPGS